MLIEYRSRSGLQEGIATMRKTELVHIDMGTVTGPAGHWVLVVKDKVIATNENLREILDLAEKYPVEDAIVSKILYPGASFY